MGAGVTTAASEVLPRREVEACRMTLGEAYDLHAAALYRYALALTCSREDAEDAVQDAFATLARRPRLLEGAASARAYLLVAVRNAAYTLLRGRRRRGALEEALSLEIPGTPDVGRQAVEGVVMRQAFLALPREQREVLALKLFEGMTFREIAATVGASQNTVASRYRYAIDHLRRALEVGDEG